MTDKTITTTAMDGGSVDHAGAIIDQLDIWSSAIRKRGSQGRGSSKKIELYGIKKLRELILDLAVRGLLVPQDQNDESASVLLEKIAAKKEQLKKDGKIKKQKQLPAISEDEKLFDLPQGWVWTQLGQISEIAPRNSLEDDLEVGFVPMPMISTSYKGDHKQEIKTWGEIKKGYTHFANGDIGLAKITPCFENSKAAVFKNLKNGYGAGTTELHIARPIPSTLDPLFILLYLKAPMFLEKGKPKMTGSAGQKRIPSDFFSGNPLPFAPLKEQHRIVAKVDELMVLCDQLEQQQENSISAHRVLVETLLSALINAPDNAALTTMEGGNAGAIFGAADAWARLAEHFDTLFTTEHSIDQLKQTILQLAVMGKLVPQDPTDEPASALLEKIAAEKTLLIADKKYQKSSKFKPKNTQINYPVNWVGVQTGEVCPSIVPNRDRPKSFTGNIPWVTLPAFPKTGWYLQSDQVELSLSEYEADLYSARLIPKNSVLMSCVGRFGLTAINKETVSSNQQVHGFVVIGGLVPEYLSFVIKVEGRALESVATSTTIPYLNKTNCESIQFGLPPLVEQHRIVSKVDELMTICDNLKAKINSAQTTQLHLTDAISEQAIN